MRVALFITCFNDALFPKTGVAMVRVLERLGHEIAFPAGQTCCGQIHFNTGYRKEALRLVRRFLGVFEAAEAVVAPSASCVAMIREQYPLLASQAGDPDLAERARGVATRVFELSEFLVRELGIEDVGAFFEARVALHPTCHSTRGIDVRDAPVRLLRAVEGVELVPLPNAADCCGFGGTFSVKNPHTSLAMMEDKIEDVRASGAEVLTALDNSCLMHLAGGLRRRGWLRESEESSSTGAGIRIVHLAEILASTRGGAR